MSKTRASWWYFIWRWYLRRGIEFFYRRLEVVGRENIPLDKPVIFASNHTNALLDPLLISYFSPTQHYFMTRGDVFRFPVIGPLFRSWRMLPLFRMKDGIDSLPQNNEVMKFITRKLVDGHAMIIFPEGSHFWKRQVHPLKKGLVRMAYDVLEADPESELCVVPVGYYYNDMTRVNQDALVSFGKPIRVRDFPVSDTQAKTFNQFNHHLREEMKKLILNIPLDHEAYEQAEAWREELAIRFRNLKVRESFELQRHFIKVISEPEFQSKTENRNLSLDELLSMPELENWWVGVKTRLEGPDFNQTLFRAIKTPFYYLAFLQFLPLFLMARLFLGKVSDHTFFSSIKFGLALFLQPVFGLLQGAIVGLVLQSWLAFGIYLVLMPVWTTLFAEWRGLTLKPVDRGPTK